MHIKRIISQYRRDMHIDLECEHCGAIEQNVPGYDDAYFHQTVIPNIVCKQCGKKADDNYRPLTTKYEEGVQI